MFYKFARFIVSVWVRLWYKVTFIRSPAIEGKSGFIVAGNHQSNLDPVLVAVGLKQQVHYMAKAELFEIKGLGFILRKAGQFPVQRGKGDTGAIDFAVSIIQSGDVLGIFPEGTRSNDGRLLRPKSGAALIAGKTGADILPVGITYDNKGKFRSKITVKFGEFIPNSSLGYTGEEISPRELKAVSKTIMAHIGALIEYRFDEPEEKGQVAKNEEEK